MDAYLHRYACDNIAVTIVGKKTDVQQRTPWEVWGTPLFDLIGDAWPNEGMVFGFFCFKLGIDINTYFFECGRHVHLHGLLHVFTHKQLI